jgi:P27 family predicted phage terminase small subunit
VPFELKRLRGNPGKRALRPGPQPSRGDRCPDAPRFLAPVAAEEWARVAPELWRLGLLTTFDHAALAGYCSAYGDWQACEEALVRWRGDLASQAWLRRTSRSCADLMIKAAWGFGMTPRARSKIAAGVQPQERSKFDGLIAD